ncbi:hypothetical protein GCM10028783_40430 [Modestobacter muralis]
MKPSAAKNARLRATSTTGRVTKNVRLGWAGVVTVGLPSEVRVGTRGRPAATVELIGAGRRLRVPGPLRGEDRG